MTIRLIYDIEYERTIPATIKEARANIPEVKNQVGFVIKAYTDSQVALVTNNAIPYKIETFDGNLVGYVAIRVVSGGASVYLKQLRPAFVQFDTEISEQINTFIINGMYVGDIL
jgi:hypothetical protein